MNTQLAFSEGASRTSIILRPKNDFRIGIVGAGPRGLYCLQSLNDALRSQRLGKTVSVVIVEPSEFPGAGNVYDPRQPAYLRMNFAAKYIDAWPERQKSDCERLSLVEWLSSRGGSVTEPHDFVPRAVVGEYLNDCFNSVVTELARQARVTIHRTHVSSVRRTDRGTWHVQAEGIQFDFDELVLTVGHEGWRHAPTRADTNTRSFIRTFPTSMNLGTDKIAPGSKVAIRGFGLTCIDAILALTEGRGGKFQRHGGEWSYVPGGEEPQRLIPFSRSGRPVLAKPDESLFVQPLELEAIWARGREIIDAVPRPIESCDLINGIWPAIIKSAASAVNHFSCKRFISAASVQEWVDQWCRESMAPHITVAALKQSHSVAVGFASPDVAWALGAAWRNLYPAIVRRFSYGGLAAEAWPTFRKIAMEMERIAFGPPAENVGRLLALIDAGIVDLSFLDASLRSGSAHGKKCEISNGGKPVAIDRCVDAVLPSPPQVCSNGPLKALLAAGIIQRLPGAHGIHVDQAGRPVTRHLHAAEGLSIIGRATEGCILGNDTLNRKLHDHPGQWAAGLVIRRRAMEAR